MVSFLVNNFPEQTRRQIILKFYKVHLLFLIITNDFYKIMYIPKIYLFGFLSRNVNLFIKKIFKRKRPYVIDSSILINNETAKKKKDTFSFPSNSIQTSLIFYKVLFDTFTIIDNVTCNVLLFLIVIITASAKILRGLHFPSDILFSIVIFMLVDYLYDFIKNSIIYFLSSI